VPHCRTFPSTCQSFPFSTAAAVLSPALWGRAHWQNDSQTIPCTHEPNKPSDVHSKVLIKTMAAVDDRGSSRAKDDTSPSKQWGFRTQVLITKSARESPGPFQKQLRYAQGRCKKNLAHSHQHVRAASFDNAIDAPIRVLESDALRSWTNRRTMSGCAITSLRVTHRDVKRSIYRTGRGPTHQYAGPSILSTGSDTAIPMQ
jgi:hypothetical protein